MKFSQRYLEEQLEIYVRKTKRVVILTTEAEKPFIEKVLLEKSSGGAFFHVQVMTCKTYLLNLFEKNRLFSYRSLSKATGLVAVKASLELPELHYLQGLDIDAGLLNALLTAYEMMADFDLSLDVKRSGLSQEKWAELMRMYEKFREVKKDELFDSEIYQKAIPYLEKDVTYVVFTHSSYSRSWQLFLKASQAIVLDDMCLPATTEREKALDLSYHQLQGQVIKDFPVDIYEVQFVHQEMALVIAEIEKRLLLGARYQEMIVYVPDTAFLDDFIRRCPYPCRYRPQQTNTQALAFLDHLWLYLKEPTSQQQQQLAYLAGMEDEILEDWLVSFQNGTTASRLDQLVAIVGAEMMEAVRALPDDLSLDDFVLLVPMLVQTSDKETSDAKDCIEIALYQSPLLAPHFKEAFLCGLNEDVYPSKISDESLLLNEELQPHYPQGTPLDHQNEEEWERVKQILVTADHYTISCHYGSLDGTDVLPSLLFNHLKALKGLKKTPTYPLPSISAPADDLILENIAAGDYQPQALSGTFSQQFYLKNGRLQISPSELESFNQCPFKHFMSYGMKLRPKKLNLQTRAKFGTLMHNLLDHCAILFNHDFDAHLAKLEETYHLTGSLDDALDDRLMALVNVMILKEHFDCEDAEDQYLLGQFQSQFLNTLKILLYHIQEGQFELTYHETSIVEAGDQVTYVGRIDRADVYEDYLKIVDYKSSNKTLDLGLCMQGFNIQMLVYLELLAKQKHLKKGAALYFNTSPRKLEAEGNMNLDGTKSEDFIKAYQMEGWLLEDDLHQVMYGVDRNFVESKICHIRYVKKNDAYSGRLLKAEQWNHLIEHIFKRMHEIVDQCFYQGDIRIYPAGSQESALRMKVSPCRYCDYGDVCLKDAFYHEERQVRQYRQEEIEQLLKGEDLDESSHII